MKKILLLLSLGAVLVMADSYERAKDNLVKNSSSEKRVQSGNKRVIMRGSHGSSGGGTSQIQANDNVNLNLVNESGIVSSKVGMSVKASGSKVQANDNVNLNLVNESEVENSNVGLSVEAE
jgi:hypothetical protein